MQEPRLRKGVQLNRRVPKAPFIGQELRNQWSNTEHIHARAKGKKGSSNKKKGAEGALHETRARKPVCYHFAKFC